jgi:hypothetical protein
MSERCRIDILKAYEYFSPASVDVIARIEHMEQMPGIDMYCTQLYEDGLLEKSHSPDNIVEFKLSNTGRSAVDGAKLNVPPTKYIIYNHLRTKEKTNASLREMIHNVIKTNGRFICLLEIQELSSIPITIPELSSVLYGLLYTEKIVVCGPLYGTLLESSMEPYVDTPSRQQLA